MNTGIKSVGRTQEGGLAHSRDLSELVDSLPTGTIAIDSEGTVILCNQAAASLLQFQKESVLGKSLFNVLRTEQDTLAKLLRQSLAGDPLQSVLLPIQNKEGVTRQILFSTSWWHGADGAHQGMLLNLTEATGEPIGMAQDMTKFQRVENDLRDINEKLQAIVHSSPAAIVALDLAGNITMWNPEAEKIFGWTEEEVLGKPLPYIPVERQQEFLSIWNHVARGVEFHQVEVRRQRKDGSPIDASISVRPLRGADNRIVGVMSVIADITERKRAELERQAILDINAGINRTSNLDELFHHIHTSLRKVVYAENCFIALYDKKTDRFEFPYWADQFDPPPDPVVVGRSRTAYVFRTGQPILMTNEIFHALKDRGEIEQVGTPCPIWVGVPLKTPEETIGVLVLQHYEDPKAYTPEDVEFLVSVGNEIAIVIERKRKEEEILFQKTRFQSLFDNSPVGVVMLDAQDRIIRINQAFELIFGYSIEEIQGRIINDLVVPPNLRPEADHLSANTQTGMPVETETTRIRKDGSPIHVHVFGVPFMSQGRQSGIFAMYVDVSKSKNLEDQLRQAQKMEAIGRLAGGIAHDFNNLLTSILGYGQLAMGRLDEKDPLKNHVQEIIKAGERAAGLTNQLLAFSRKQVLEPVILNLNSVVADMDKMLRRLIGEDVELITHLDSQIGSVRADPGQMSQVIMNLAVNSRDAMPQGGKLIIETSSTDLDEAYVKQRPGMTAGPYIMLAVTDTGCGMDPETLSQMFEPFFTTKEAGKGTGLGLSTVYGIVKQSNGHIWAYSELGRGSCIKIYLPRVETVAAQTTPSEDVVPKGTGTILVVEDEDAVRNMIHNTLQVNGYMLLEAPSGMEALELSQKYKGKIDLLLTDVVMPQMSGMQLAEQLSASRPEMKVVFMSGYTEDGIIQMAEMKANLHFLQKPFSLNRLLSKIQGALHGAPARQSTTESDTQGGIRRFGSLTKRGGE